MSNPIPDLLALTSIADGSPRDAAPIRNNNSAIQTAVNEIIAALNSGVAGQLLQSGGPTALQWGPKITTSTLAGGPPGSPVDQDIWIATAVNAVGGRWHFQYNAGSASASKWEYIGGAPMYSIGDPNAIANTKTQVGATGFWYDAATMSLTLARAGDYLLRGVAEIDLNGGASPGLFQVGVFAAGVTLGAQPGGINSVNSSFESRSAMAPAVGVAANTIVGVCLSPPTPGTNKLRSAYIEAIPVRIS